MKPLNEYSLISPKKTLSETNWLVSKTKNTRCKLPTKLTPFISKEFTFQYASLLVQYNSSYLELVGNKDKLTEVLEKLEMEYYKEG